MNSGGAEHCQLHAGLRRLVLHFLKQSLRRTTMMSPGFRTFEDCTAGAGPLAAVTLERVPLIGCCAAASCLVPHSMALKMTAGVAAAPADSVSKSSRRRLACFYDEPARGRLRAGKSDQ